MYLVHGAKLPCENEVAVYQLKWQGVILQPSYRLANQSLDQICVCRCSRSEIGHMAQNCPESYISVCAYFLVHGQVTIIFVVSVCLFVCLSVSLFVCAEFFSAVFDPIWIKLGHVLHVRV